MRRLRPNVNNTWMMILGVLVVGCSSGAPLVSERDCLPPDWVVSPPALDQHYWGAGSESLDNRDSRGRAYEEAVGNLALMAGQTISASFEEYQSFQGSDREGVLESKIFREVRTLARHELRGITIRDFWTDPCEEEYHVLVVIGWAEANRQIGENAKKQAHQEVREAILQGLSNLESRVITLEADVDDLQTRTGEIEQRYGGLLVRLARLEQAAVAREKKAEAPAGRETVSLAGEVEAIRQDMVRKIPSEVVARKIQAAEWFEKALALYDRIMEQGTPSRKALEEVIHLNSMSIKFNPHSSGAFNNRGAAYAARGDHESSLEDFTRALELDADDAIAYGNRGAAYGRLGRYDLALGDMAKAIELDPHDSASYSNRGIVYRLKGEHDRSLQDYTRALELDPQNAAAFNNRGTTWLDMLEYEHAVQDFTRALDLDPAYAEAYNNRGRALLEAGSLEGAIKDITRAIELRPDYGLAHYNRGEAFLRQGRKERALRDLSRSCELGFEHACTVSRNLRKDMSG